MKLSTKLKTSAILITTALLGSNAMANLPTSARAIEIPAQTLQLTQEWDKIFPKSDKVEHRKVTFKNRFDITLVGDLYVPKGATGKLSAVVVSGAFGAVKEQSSGIYAQELAERGFAALAFDPSFTGESSGLPRHMVSPDISTEDYSAAVDFLGNLELVDREKIGVLGICGQGGFALSAAQQDTRIKAVATSTMYDMSRFAAKGYNDSNDNAEARQTQKSAMNNTRWEASKNDYADLNPPEAGLPDPKTNPTGLPQFVQEYMEFYRTDRGYHPRAINSNPADNGWTVTGFLGLVNLPLLQYAEEIQTPVLIVHGEKAHSRYFSEDAFKALGSKNKELVIVPDATHVDLYDKQSGKIPFDKFESFFKANLK